MVHHYKNTTISHQLKILHHLWYLFTIHRAQPAAANRLQLYKLTNQTILFAPSLHLSEYHPLLNKQVCVLAALLQTTNQLHFHTFVHRNQKLCMVIDDGRFNCSYVTQLKAIELFTRANTILCSTNGFLCYYCLVANFKLATLSWFCLY